MATGRIEQGIVKVGDEVEIVGLNDTPTKTTITGVEMFKKQLNQGQASTPSSAASAGERAQSPTVRERWSLQNPSVVRPQT